MQQAIDIKNKNNALIKAELLNILPQLETYVGKRIKTLNGNSKKFVINWITDKIRNSCYLDISKYSIWFHLNDEAICIGDMEENGVLIGIRSFEDINNAKKLDVVINLETVIEMVKEYKELKSKMEKMENDFPLNYSINKFI